MAEIHPTNTLDEAAAWLAERTGDDWSAAKLLSAGAVGKLSLLAVNPDWIAPGVGELKRQRNVEVVSLVSGEVFPLCPGEPIASVSDGFVATNDWTLRTLLNHGRVNLINAPGVIGVAPFIDASHLRVLKDELKRFGAALPPRTPKIASVAEKSEPPTQAAVVTPAKPIARQRWQEEEILRAIAELGYTATALPKPPTGKKGPKAEVRKKLTMTVGIFDLAWERLRANGDILDAVQNPTPSN